MPQPKLLLTTSPFLKQGEDTPYLMRQVIYSLLPVVFAAIYYYGLSALLVIAAAMLGATGAEALLSLNGDSRRNTISDGSAAITGLLLALTLPPGIPLWMAFLGGIISIVLGKLVFGGMGSNIFNPSLVGRAFLQAAFPVSLTTWAGHGNWASFGQLRGANLSLPFMKAVPDGLSSATPLAQMKFEGKLAGLGDLITGNTSGSLGETSALIIMLAGIYLVITKVANWRIPLGIIAGVLLFSGLLHYLNPAQYLPPLYHLFSGGLMFGAVFMATDPVSSPVTQRGCWIFGAGIGLLVIVIRTFGGLPEGVMYAILFMNALTPLINRYTHPRVYGEQKKMAKREVQS